MVLTMRRQKLGWKPEQDRLEKSRDIFIANRTVG